MLEFKARNDTKFEVKSNVGLHTLVYWISTKPESWSNLVNFKWIHIV